MPRLSAAVVYTITLPLAGALALAAEVAAFWLAESLRVRSLPMAVLLNVVPALVTGFLVYLGVARALAHRHVMTGRASDHFVRASPLYVIVLVIGSWMGNHLTSPGFGIFVQFILWPWLAVIGGIVADGLVGRLSARRTSAIRRAATVAMRT